MTRIVHVSDALCVYRICIGTAHVRAHGIHAQHVHVHVHVVSLRCCISSVLYLFGEVGLQRSRTAPMEHSAPTPATSRPPPRVPRDRSCSIPPHMRTSRQREHEAYMSAMAARSDALAERLLVLDDGLEALERLADVSEADVETTMPAGLSPEQVSLLACHVCRPDDDLDEDAACAICLCVPAAGERVCTLACAHQFHDSCIVKWFAQSSLCPLCKCHALGDQLSPRVVIPSAAASSAMRPPLSPLPPPAPPPQQVHPVSPPPAATAPIEAPRRRPVTPLARVLTADGISASYYREQAAISQAARAHRLVGSRDGPSRCEHGVSCGRPPHRARPLVPSVGGSAAAPSSRAMRHCEVSTVRVPPPAPPPRPLRQSPPPEAAVGSAHNGSGVTCHQHAFNLGPTTTQAQPQQRRAPAPRQARRPSSVAPPVAAPPAPLAVTGNTAPVAPPSAARGGALPAAAMRGAMRRR